MFYGLLLMDTPVLVDWQRPWMQLLIGMDDERVLRNFMLSVWLDVCIRPSQLDIMNDSKELKGMLNDWKRSLSNLSYTQNKDCN